ncbi:hypothetical protein GOP47_0000906 [Adiantum capillus-veneris]|uniref:non-specific serine/threonine protein kinase n=1 Tax=Adiantum capillus-veneris TaxID=13818 RepID=A0A9D4VED9_ADICA|nr:hypothetical protein GOP47_0000906 [Adiantum capillus-veneris]
MPSSSTILQFFGTVVIVLQLVSAQLDNPSSSSLCPLNFTLLNDIKYVGDEVGASTNVTFRCTSFIQALHYVLAGYTAHSGFFLVPDAFADTCWEEFVRKLQNLGTSLDVESQCNLRSTSIALSSATCRNITSVNNLTELVPQSTLLEVSKLCLNASTASLSLCTACTSAVVLATSVYFPGTSSGRSINSCQDTVALYAASTATNVTHGQVAACLFNIADFDASSDVDELKYIYGGVGAAIGLFIVFGLLLSLYLHHRKGKSTKGSRAAELRTETLSTSNSALVWFTLNEIRAATGNFSRQNMVGMGRYGNVYKGKLPNGSVVAVKRFKNCSPMGNDDFFHEIEVISSVRHRNLVGFIGGCVDRTDVTGYQRIIVCEYMPNGSLYDHLFVKRTPMDWPRRQNIAMGIVRGLAYLHQEVQPAIIHRDVKASNILLDANWNAKVADFGLAKFRPEGASHLTTRVAGTQGYVAPEYVLYGQVTEKSDVYSFGIVLLELLTRRKNLRGAVTERPMLVSDWAWCLVKQGKVMDVIDAEMDRVGPLEVVERFVLLALLCAHPQVPFRPTLDEVLKIMENDQPLPPLPERPVPYTIQVAEQGSMSRGSGFQSFSSYGSEYLSAVTG